MKKVEHEQYRRSFPYYKVQYYDENVMAWHDIQRRFSSEVEACVEGTKLGRKWRVMEVTRTGRRVVL